MTSLIKMDFLTKSRGKQLINVTAETLKPCKMLYNIQQQSKPIPEKKSESKWQTKLQTYNLPWKDIYSNVSELQ